jgi:hypothetical protein
VPDETQDLAAPRFGQDLPGIHGLYVSMYLR